jgi:hypothetical protein
MPERCPIGINGPCDSLCGEYGVEKEVCWFGGYPTEIVRILSLEERVGRLESVNPKMNPNPSRNVSPELLWKEVTLLQEDVIKLRRSVSLLQKKKRNSKGCY